MLLMVSIANDHLISCLQESPRRFKTPTNNMGSSLSKFNMKSFAVLPSIWEPSTSILVLFVHHQKVNFIYETSYDQTRLSYGGPSIVKHYCYPRNKDNAELGSTFKAVHVKSLLWWLALRTREASLKSPGESCPQQRWVCEIGFMWCAISIPEKSKSLFGPVPQLQRFNVAKVFHGITGSGHCSGEP